MSTFPSPFAGLMLSDVSEDPNSPKSLLDLINSHNSLDQSSNNEDVSLPTSKFLNVDDDPSTEENISSLPSCLGNLIIVGDTTDKESNDCDTLEAYTKSFLNSRGNNIFSSKKPAPPPNFNGHILKTHNDITTDLKQIDERLQNIQVYEPHKTETRKIDLTAALLSRSRTSSSSQSTEVSVETKQSIFTYPVRECNIDLSSLADDNLLYSSSSSSPIGYVISKRWKRSVLPKKYRKLERIRPYNIARSFKFDIPSPDECVAKNRTRNTSVSET